MPDASISWSDLQHLMITPQPDLTVRGIVSTDEHELYFGSFESEHQAPPLTPIVLADEDGPATLHVRIKGARHRLDRLDGTVFFIQDTDRAWQFHDEHPNRPDEGGSEVSYVGTVWSLVVRPDRDRFEGNDFTRPTGPPRATEYLGRAAWEVQLAPPSHKPFPLTYVVDAETGLLLQERNERAGLLAGWLEFEVGADIDDSVFGWNGPVVTEEERDAAMWAEIQAERREGAAWVEQHITPQPVTVQLTYTGPIQVNEHEKDGSFDGCLGSDPTLSIGRRPLGRRDFWRADASTYQWTSGEWRWQVMAHGATLTPESLRSLQEQLRALPD
ncbi:hypothetical protein [Flexivirga alba]|uniref:Uncharacterized protein n=1 Tax=Flexivirga alba TaxID=702742 RepID=A0ABW2AK19_9MICO